ncbi:hypothetical protein ACFVY0_44050 [Streptomyces sp. NPDC058286]|uniref:hypothetical protein n=1 Tax=Streptomyces sp. NPDC058286 TaxID=3346422 RepID=UPI0036EDF404
MGRGAGGPGRGAAPAPPPRPYCPASCARNSSGREPDRCAGINFAADTIEPAQGIVKELDIRFSLYYSPQEFGQTLAMLASGEIDAAALVTGRTGLDGVADAFERLSDSPSDAKIVIDPSL